MQPGEPIVEKLLSRNGRFRKIVIGERLGLY